MTFDKRDIRDIKVQGAVTMVQDRKTGEWYNPIEKIAQMMSSAAYIEQMKRMKNL